MINPTDLSIDYKEILDDWDCFWSGESHNLLKSLSSESSVLFPAFSLIRNSELFTHVLVSSYEFCTA